MANPFYVTIESRHQGTLEGDSTTRGYEGKHTGYAYEYNVDRPEAADAIGSARAGSRPQRSLVTFVKKWNKSSPQLLKAALDNEQLNVLFEFLRPDPRSGALATFYTIRLEDARISHLHTVVDAIGGSKGALSESEEIGLTFGQMEVTWVANGVVAIDDRRTSTSA